jgi:hypothetical protein
LSVGKKDKDRTKMLKVASITLLEGNVSKGKIMEIFELMELPELRG